MLSNVQIVTQLVFICFYVYIAWRASRGGPECKTSILGTVGIFSLFIIVPFAYVLLMISFVASNFKVEHSSSTTTIQRKDNAPKMKVPPIVKNSLSKIMSRIE